MSSAGSHKSILFSTHLLKNHQSNKSKPFCNCKMPTHKCATCKCGEEASSVQEWAWDKDNMLPETRINGPEVIFHPTYSQGTSVIRGDKPLEIGKHHYWEIKVMSSMTGTDIMIGIGSNEVDILAHRYKFSSFLGIDKKSWGYSYRGLAQHDGKLKYYGKKFTKGCIIGVYLNLHRGILEFYLNRKSLGPVYSNIPLSDDVQIYPMISSTSAKSSMKLINACSFEDNLKFASMKVISKYPSLLGQLKEIPGLKSLCNDLWFLQCGEGAPQNDEFARNNLQLEDIAILGSLRKKKFNFEMSSDSSNDGIYENLYKFPKVEESNSTSDDSTSSSCDSDIVNEFFSNH